MIFQESEKNGIREFVLVKSSDGGMERTVLQPRFSQSCQVQSFDAIEVGDDMLLLLLSERVKIMGEETCTEWDVFASINDLARDRYRVIPLSMSEAESVNVQFEPGPADERLECSAESCMNAQRPVPGLHLSPD